MDRLSPLDTTFLHVEDGVSHMHLGSVSRFEGPPPAQEDVLAALAAKLHLAPRYRQRVRFTPLAAGRPVWADDPHFCLDYHVRRTALPAPASDDELRTLVGRVMSLRLDRSRPLWELWVVEGLADGTWAMISKLHHAMVDGIAASNLVTSLMDERPDAPPADPVPWTPAPEPRGAALVATALAERARWPLRELGALRGVARHPRSFAGHARETAQGLAAYAGIVRPPAPTSLNGAIGRQRRWDFAWASLADIKTIRAALGGTVNDVVLTAIGGGMRDLLESRDEPVDRPLRSLVPVSVRARDANGVYDNRVSAIFADLLVSIADPVERLHAMRAQMDRLKDAHEAVAGEVLTSLAGFAPEALRALSVGIATRTPQHNVSTVTTNVPGPQRPLFICGRRMLVSYPYVPLGGHVRVGIAIYSYDGGLAFGVTGDYDRAPDIGVLCAGIEREIASLMVVEPPLLA